MRHYLITSQAGQVYGLWAGETEAHALAAMHHDAGVDVIVDANAGMTFADPDDRVSAGVVEDWYFDELTADSYDDIAKDLGKMPYDIKFAYVTDLGLARAVIDHITGHHGDETGDDYVRSAIETVAQHLVVRALAPHAGNAHHDGLGWVDVGPMSDAELREMDWALDEARDLVAAAIGQRLDK